MTDLVSGTLTTRISRAAGIESFRVLPDRELPFIAGQYVQVVFAPEEPADRELNKFLSLSCAPGRGYLEVTKKLSASAFSGRLCALKAGDRLFLRGPFGDCVLREPDRRVVFLAGGIGITPVISLVEDALSRRPDFPIQVFASNRSEDEFAFLDELAALAAGHPSLRLHPRLTAGTPRDPRVRSGRITKELLLEEIPTPAEWVFFIFGPPAMVAAMRETCLEIGVPGGNLRTEGFAGY